MENTFANKWSSLADDALKASKELEEINTKILDKVTENQINMSNAFLEANTNYFESLAESKKYPDLVAHHKQLLNNYSEVFSNATTNAGELVTTVKAEYEEWIKRGIENSTSNELFSTFVDAKEVISKRNGTKKDSK